MRHLTAFFSVTLLFSACSPKPKTSLVPAPPTAPIATTTADLEKEIAGQGSELLASLRRTPCFGKCPVFDLKVYSDGSLLFLGQMNVPLLGRHEGKVPHSTLLEIARKASEIGYFSLPDKFPVSGKPITDLPKSYTTFHLGLRVKSIENQYDAPVTLPEFEQMLWDLVGKVNWKPIQTQD